MSGQPRHNLRIRQNHACSRPFVVSRAPSIRFFSKYRRTAAPSDAAALVAWMLATCRHYQHRGAARATQSFREGSSGVYCMHPAPGRVDKANIAARKR